MFPKSSYFFILILNCYSSSIFFLGPLDSQPSQFYGQELLRVDVIILFAMNARLNNHSVFGNQYPLVTRNLVVSYQWYSFFKIFFNDESIGFSNKVACRQLCPFDPAQLACLSIDLFALEIILELSLPHFSNLVYCYPAAAFPSTFSF